MDGDCHNSSDSSDWDEVDTEEEAKETLCLFCNEHLNSPEEVFQHSHVQHGFDIVVFAKNWSVDTLSYIKLINYIRSLHPSSMQLIDATCKVWEDDMYMKPVSPEDPLLMFDFESYLEEKLTETSQVNDSVTLPKSEFESIIQRLSCKELQLENALRNIQEMRKVVQDLLNTDGSSYIHNAGVGSLKTEEDAPYFSTYDHFGIHLEMLQDEVRTKAYRDAVLNNDVFSGKTVLDVGCGTAILSMFVAKAGAQKVIAVDQSDIIYQAMDIVRKNNLQNKIEFCKGRIEDITVPANKVDIIISEWMGYFLLFEGMLDSVLFARDKYLNPDGLMLPDKCSITLAAVCDAELHKKYVSFWDSVYGFDLSCMKQETIKEAVIEVVSKENICSQAVIVKELDLMTCTIQDCEFTSHFKLEFTKSCLVTAIVGYFDCCFDKGLSHKVTLSTSPMTDSTHWKQTIFLLSSPFSVKAGETMTGKIICCRDRKELRSLIVTLNLGDKSQMYFVH